MVSERFISEAIEPVAGSFDTGRMAAGEPGLPRGFIWRGKPFAVDAVLRTWRETGPCHHGSSEQYVRKHWYEVRLTTGAVARLYFERQARSRSETRRRWWLFSLTEGETSDPAAAHPRQAQGG